MNECPSTALLLHDAKRFSEGRGGDRLVEEVTVSLKKLAGFIQRQSIG